MPANNTESPAAAKHKPGNFATILLVLGITAVLLPTINWATATPKCDDDEVIAKVHESYMQATPYLPRASGQSSISRVVEQPRGAMIGIRNCRATSAFYGGLNLNLDYTITGTNWSGWKIAFSSAVAK